MIRKYWQEVWILDLFFNNKTVRNGLIDIVFFVSERIVGDTKILTEYTINADGKKTKIVRTFKVKKRHNKPFLTI